MLVLSDKRGTHKAVLLFSIIINFKLPLFLIQISGDAGVVKRVALKPQWVSPYEGSNPFPRTLKMRNVTLCFVIQNGRILLGNKKLGFGKDKINGFGGKVQNNETIEEAAVRELKEEVGLISDKESLQKVGEIDFFFPEPKAKEWNQTVHVFILNN